ncbi:unnamed protein product [Linum tenue]|uniref:WRKY domain-containing protein n=1 Tax=Linum tenue TaxID=586396 RepID=A0AAV0QMD2_9ROSI|nr:unnamed protein product [Linum tenue]
MAHHHHHHAASSSEWEHKWGSLAAELTAGRDVAKQLQLILSFTPPQPSSSEQAATREVLVQKILASYENALSMLSSSRKMTPADQHHHCPSHRDDGDIGTVVMMTMKSSESSPPGTRSGSPGSEDSDHDLFKDTTSSSRKRKSIPRWTHQVRVGPGMGLEGPLDDGFSWRKYGQKDILGAKYPRGYYRCTLRNVQGCLATKQVQRSDDDSTVFEITYRGRHTCTQSQSPSTSSSPAPNNISPRPSEPAMPPAAASAKDRQHEQLLLNFRRGLNVVVTDDGSEFDCSPPTTATAATTFAGSLFFPPPQVITTSDNNTNISYGGEQSTTAAAAPPATVGSVDFPFGNMDHLFDDQTTFTFDNSGFFS